jgi:predicted phage-related endonuclease
MKGESTMSNPNMESKIKELMELKRMKEEIEAEIAAAEDEIKSVMGDEETLLAGAFKVDWKTVITSRIDTAALKKMMPEIAERFMKQTTTRRFCVR